MREREPVLQVRNLTKQFGGTLALAGVDLEVGAGEIHGLIGANGSGKSTLIKILAGYHDPDHGTVRLNGRPLQFPLDGAVAQQLGLSFVHQDFGLFPSATAAENLFAAEIGSRRRRWVAARRDNLRAGRILEGYGLDIPPTSGMDQLSMSDKAKLAIIRAVEQARGFEETSGGQAGLLVLDEATAPLAETDVRDVFHLVRRIAAAGDAVIFVSHHLNEILELTDRTTVLREGRAAESRPTVDLSETSLVEAITGRAPPARAQRVPPPTTVHSSAARIRGLAGGAVKGVDLDVQPGHVLGLAGLPGSGAEDVVRLLFGMSRATAGLLECGEVRRDVTQMSPSRAVRTGIAHISGDRHGEGGYMSLDLTDNVLGQVLPAYRRRGVLRRRDMDQAARALLDVFAVVPARPAEQLQHLSGGNQQKVIVAKWLQAAPRLLLLQNPTAGVDIGARTAILDLIRRTARGGTPVLYASSDFAELSQVADQVAVIVRGRVHRVLAGRELTESSISACIYESSAA